MRQWSITGVFVAILIAQPGALAQTSGNAMAPGLWEMTIQTVEPFEGPPVTTRSCITTEMKHPDPTPADPADGCQVTHLPSPGNEKAYSVECPKLKTSSTVRFTYFGVRYEGVATMKWNGVDFRRVHSGRRIGACDPAPRGPAGTEN